MKVSLKKRWSRKAREDLVWLLQFAAMLWTCVVGIGTIVVVIIVGLFQGTIADGAESQAPGYPAFTTLSAGMIIPALLLAVAFVIAVPLPLKEVNAPKRYEIAFYSLVALAVSLAAAVLEVFDPAWVKFTWLATWAILTLLIPLVLVRAVLGWLRLVPRSWREEQPKRRGKQRAART